MYKTALILGNGEPPSRELINQFIGGDTLLLCADGGADTARRYDLVPDYIVGDLDSISRASSAGVDPTHIIRVDADNTGTDIQKVLRHAVDLGISEAVLLGFTGGRTDHLLWNLSVFKTFAEQIALRIVDEYCDLRLIGQRIRFRATIGQKISLCPLNGPVDGITTTGLKFALQNESLVPGLRDGISNEVVGDIVEIEVERGDLLLCVQRHKDFREIETA
ncbi:MAG: thiamine diphosphokinase [Gemmatimonadetes bacterium]|jgi:thiamine pyrophosphokinase|nr:thiamine diphosphokinase [Gemmatimonadota bacterium]|tara:strand:- start:218 stop:877 length:660 start_codon:yes stop_codon:yes gene_type:complete